ncbi:MAG: PAS domain S-box protein [Pyrinomonadaceae bacterium]
MRSSRFSIASLSIMHRLPLLIGTLLLSIIVASTWASYRGVKESAMAAGRERLQNLTQQLATLTHQSTVLLLTKTFTAANDPAIRAFLQSPSPATRSGASVVLQQFTAAQDPSSLQVELWDTNHSLVLTGPDGAPPVPVGLETEFKQSAQDPFKAVGAFRLVKDIVVSPALAAVKDDAGKPIGYLVRWRRVSASPEPRRLRDLLGNEATLYFGNTKGDVWTDLVNVVPGPPTDLGSTLEVTHYLRDGNSVMALGRPIKGTPFFLVVEFPDHVILSQAAHFLRRVMVIDAVLLAIGLVGAIALSRSITHPLRSLTKAASAISGGEYSRVVDIRQKDELGALASAFNVMVSKVGDSQRELGAKVRELELAEEAASKLAAIVECSHDAIIGKTSDGIITSWNQGAEKLYGYSADEVVGRSIAILATPEHSDEVAGILEKLRRGDSIDHFETERVAKDGKRIFVSLTISPIREKSGAISGFATIARDISERKQAEGARRSSELRYRRLFESAKDGILILDGDSGRIVDANPYVAEMLRYTKEQLAGKELWEIGFFKDVAASRVAFAELQKEGYIRYEDLPLQTREGQVRQVEFVSNSYLVGEKRVIQCNIRDISERKEAETSLREANHSLELALKELQQKSGELATMTQQLWQTSKLATMGELAASVAHELNNPLATVALRAESALEALPEGDPKRHALEVISQEVERMATLVSNLLLFSRRSHSQISTLDVREELRNLLEFIQYHLRSHKIRIVQDFAAVLPTVQADQQQLRQVFLNLITNASDAMPNGGTLTVRSHPGAMANGQAAVVIEFSDTGSGVQTADLPKLWEPFFTTKPEGKGTGLGLPICRRTVEEHRGTIAIETGPGKGMTVRITLPATIVDIEVAA